VQAESVPPKLKAHGARKTAHRPVPAGGLGLARTCVRQAPHGGVVVSKSVLGIPAEIEESMAPNMRQCMTGVTRAAPLTISKKLSIIGRDRLVIAG
jgi:hypothetical protein